MSVDYRLLAGFESSQRRHEAAREILPERWRDDPRPVAQIIDDYWATLIAANHHDPVGSGSSAVLPALVFDDR